MPLSRPSSDVSMMETVSVKVRVAEPIFKSTTMSVLPALTGDDIHLIGDLRHLGVQAGQLNVVGEHARHVNPDDAVAAQGDFLGINDDFRLFQQIFRAAVNHRRVACRFETPYAAFILGEEVISLLNVRFVS